MTRRLVGCLPVLLVALVLALLRRRQPEPPPEPDDGVQPVDVYLVTLARDDPRVGMFSRN